MAMGGTFDIDKYTVGRVRFVEGDSAKFSFKGKEVNVGFDYLVLIGGTFETKKGKLEIVDLNNDVFWFDEETFFNFESFDPAGDMTTLFLGKGSFACRTNKSFSIITAAGSILFPANGRYIVEKADFGKTETVITVLEGEKPAVIKRSGIFNKFEFETKTEGNKIYSWMMKKEKDWAKTVRRANVFSNVSIMSPYVADTMSDNSLSWVKVGYVKPYYTASSIINGNEFYYWSAASLRASGIAHELVNQMTEMELNLFFITHNYNSIKWAWNVESGWHAVFYYDPLAYFGSEYRNAFFYPNASLRYKIAPESALYFYNGHYSYLPERSGSYSIDRPQDQYVPNSLVKPSILESSIRSEVKPSVRPIELVKQSLVKTRMDSDKALVKVKNVSKLSITNRDVKITRYRTNDFNVNSPRTNSSASVKPIRSYYNSRVIRQINTSTTVNVPIKKK